MIEALPGRDTARRRAVDCWVSRRLDTSTGGLVHRRSGSCVKASSRISWAISTASNGTYGTRRVTAELRLGYGLVVNRKAVKATMRRLGIKVCPQARADDAAPRATAPPRLIVLSSRAEPVVVTDITSIRPARASGRIQLMLATVCVWVIVDVRLVPRLVCAGRASCVVCC